MKSPRVAFVVAALSSPASLFMVIAFAYTKFAGEPVTAVVGAVVFGLLAANTLAASLILHRATSKTEFALAMCGSTLPLVWIVSLLALFTSISY